MTRTPIRALQMASISALIAALLSATLTPAFAQDINNDPNIVVDDPNTPISEPTEEPTEEPVENPSTETPTGTPKEVLLGASGPSMKVFKTLNKKSIETARNLAPKQTKRFHKTPAYAKWYAKLHIKQRYGWSKKQFSYLAKLWGKESAWKYRALGMRNYYVGIPQLNKKAILANGFSIKQFRKHPEIQIQLGAKYIKSRYGTPKHAWKHFLRRSWY